MGNTTKIYSGKGNKGEYKLWKAAYPVLMPIMKTIGRMGNNVRIPGIGLLISDATLIREVLGNPVFSKMGKGTSETLWTPIVGPNALINMDGAAHMQLRRKLGPIFSPRAIGELSAQIMDEAIADMVTRLNNHEEVDITQEVSKVAGAMICRLTGLDASDESIASTVSKAHELTAQASLKGTLTEAQGEYSRSLLSDLTEPVIKAYNIGDETTVPGRMKALGLSEEEAIGASSAFIIAGTETVLSYIPRMVALLLEKDWLKKLSENPDLMGDYINEGLRLTVPTPVMLRGVSEDATIGGKKIKKGQRAIILTMLACQRLGHGDVFDPERPIPAPIQKIWFGAGSHFCIGMPLAMAQTKAFIQALLDVTVDGDISIISSTPLKNTLAPSYQSLIIRKINNAA